ncbi:MAG: glycerophosphodiester phosphodiesterase [Microbacteriaceae bacterium]|nr:glycerophosphodiester phosphodiesterase [Microbacteriaceae bacterium]
MTYFDPALPRLLAHRGYAAEAPENTIAAFEAAMALGVRHIETDAHVTADGVAVLWHDPTLERWDGSRHRIDRLTLAELQEREIGGHGISTVAEALWALPGARFNIDVKDPRAVEPVADAIEWVDACRRVLVTSFEERSARALRERLPEAYHGASTRTVVRAVIADARRNERALKRALEGIDAVQIPPRFGRLDLVTPRRIAAYRRHVREVHVWTINDPVEMRRLVGLGVDGIVTDRVDRAVELD